ncbi:L-rhamnose mutarotase [Litchfieldella xinjiangensis]|uniref:L-rhamnose mutarotase n=1 Tax=Litchfieldella xinjiangensis TaxID=1166948 RepID=UPI000A98064E|nr:L-rhamnose mutarotase [Halomonas xinjiangensis]
MPIQAFRMTLHPGQAEEYRQRHDALWPELAEALQAAGVEEYRIFLDPKTHHLFAIMVLCEDHRTAHLPELAVMRRWWDYMADIMDTHEDQSPISVDLEEVFTFLPGAPVCK